MIIEQILGIIAVLTGLVLIILTVSYSFTIRKELPRVTNIAGGIILFSLGISFLVSGFPVIGGALTAFGENPTNFIIIASVLVVTRLIVIVSGIVGVVAVINQRRRSKKNE